MDKICLIIPPSPFLADEHVFPPLGILYVASVLEKAGYPVEVLDLSGISNYLERLRFYVADSRCQIYGITATTPQFPLAVTIRDAITASEPDARIIIGGPHVTMSHSAYLTDKAKGTEGRATRSYRTIARLFSSLVVGDGELAVFDALKGDGGTLVDAGSRKSKLFLRPKALDAQPFPARHLIDLGSYRYEIDGRAAQSMITQRGCPFGCKFCGGRNTESFRVVREREVPNVLHELEELVLNYGYRGVMFYDDELNLQNQRLEELLQALIAFQEDKGIDLRFRGFVTPRLFTQRQATMLYRAGFRVVLAGVESGSEEILSSMAKQVTPELNSRCIRLCRGAGLKIKALMSIGHPGETRRTVDQSIAWVLENRPDEIDWTIVTPYPGSPYFDESVSLGEGIWAYTDPQSGRRLYSREVDYSIDMAWYKGVPGNYVANVWTDELDSKELCLLRDKAAERTRGLMRSEKRAVRA